MKIELNKKLDKEERFKGTLAGPLILKKIPTELHCIWKEYNDYVEKGKIYKSINTTSDSIKKTNKKIKQAKLVEPEVSLESNDLIESDEVVDINETGGLANWFRNFPFWTPVDRRQAMAWWGAGLLMVLLFGFLL